MAEYVVPDRVRRAFKNVVESERISIDLMVVLSWLLERVDEDSLAWMKEDGT